jgi:hypothetical protein
MSCKRVHESYMAVCQQGIRYQESIRLAKGTNALVESSIFKASLLCPAAALASGADVNHHSQLHGTKWHLGGLGTFQHEETLPQPDITRPAQITSNLGNQGALFQIAQRIMLADRDEVPDDERFERHRQLFAAHHTGVPYCLVPRSNGLWSV